MKIKIISIVTVLAMLLCILPSCGEKEGPQIKTAMLYVGDTNKQGFCITIDGETLKYETKTALTAENFEAKKAFIEKFGKENCEMILDKKQLDTYYKKLTEITSAWNEKYYPADGTKFRQYWFVDLAFDDGTYKSYEGYETWPENYGEYITLTQQLCGKLFPEKIAAYMPEDIEAENGVQQSAE